MNKKTWAKRMKDSGVSPIIATILLVAITVVLAAVLYVMVSGFTHSPGAANSAGLTEAQNSANNFTVTITSVSASNIAIGNLRLVVNGTSYAISSSVAAGSVIKLESTGGITVYFGVLGGNSGTYLQTGDFFYILGSGLTGMTVTLYSGGSQLGSTTL